MTRRTTLTLPADALTQAQRIASARKVNLSTVIAEALHEGLRLQTATERSEEVLSAYKKAFSGFRPKRWRFSTASSSNRRLGVN